MATLTVKEAAIECNTDARTLRKFLRSTESPIAPVGKGSRYAIERKAMRSLKTRFTAWNDARTADATDDAPDAPDAA